MTEKGNIKKKKLGNDTNDTQKQPAYDTRYYVACFLEKKVRSQKVRNTSFSKTCKREVKHAQFNQKVNEQSREAGVEKLRAI